MSAKHDHIKAQLEAPLIATPVPRDYGQSLTDLFAKLEAAIDSGDLRAARQAAHQYQQQTRYIIDKVAAVQEGIVDIHSLYDEARAVGVTLAAQRNDAMKVNNDNALAMQRTLVSENADKQALMERIVELDVENARLRREASRGYHR